MSDTQQYDGMSDLPEEREMNSDPLGERSDVVSTTIERRGDYPNGTVPGSKMTLEGYSDEGGPDLNSDFDDAARRELEEYQDESDLPRDTSSTAKD